MAHYISYYENQVGGGGIEHVFTGSSYQRGHGVGSFLAGLFRKALPFITKGARVLGKEALRAGANIIDDVGNNVPLKQAFKSRMYESRDNLKRKTEEKVENLL